MTEAFLVVGVAAAIGVAYLVRDYLRAFGISAALTWLFALIQAFLGNTGCYFSPSLRIHNPIERLFMRCRWPSLSASWLFCSPTPLH